MCFFWFMRVLFPKKTKDKWAPIISCIYYTKVTLCLDVRQKSWHDPRLDGPQDVWKTPYRIFLLLNHLFPFGKLLQAQNQHVFFHHSLFFPHTKRVTLRLVISPLLIRGPINCLGAQLPQIERIPNRALIQTVAVLSLPNSGLRAESHFFLRNQVAAGCTNHLRILCLILKKKPLKKWLKVFQPHMHEFVTICTRTY